MMYERLCSAIFSLHQGYQAVGRRLAACRAVSTENNRICILAGCLLFLLVSTTAYAQGLTAQPDQTKINHATKMLLEFIEGGFGALIMVSAGIGAIISSAFGQYRAALNLLVVALGAFILRSLIRTFFIVEF